MEHRYRSLIKAASWRVLGTIDTFVVSFIITRKIGIALSIGGIEIITKMTLYYFHERMWDKIKLGRKESGPEYQI